MEIAKTVKPFRNCYRLIHTVTPRGFADSNQMPNPVFWFSMRMRFGKPSFGYSYLLI